MSSQLILGLGKDGGLTDELSKNLVVSSAATRTRLIGMAMHEQAERDDRRVALAVSADLDTPGGWGVRGLSLVSLSLSSC